MSTEYIEYLTARRKADRAAIACRIVDLADEFRFAAWHQPEHPGTRQTAVTLEFPRGLKLTVGIDGSGRGAGPDVYVLSWHGVDNGVWLHPGMFGRVNECHGHKATDVAHGAGQLLRILTERFRVIRDDSAFIITPGVPEGFIPRNAEPPF